MEPWRESLVQRLQAYARVSGEPSEQTVVVAFIAFISAHDDCLWRTCVPGHLTASAWIVDPARQHTLLTHHRKLDRWLQLGGHVDGNPDLAAAAMREAREESGLVRLTMVSGEILDLDRHLIPARGAEPEHWHYDVRFLIEADPSEPVIVTLESKDLAWVELTRVAALNPEESLARLVRKTGKPRI